MKLRHLLTIASAAFVAATALAAPVQAVKLVPADSACSYIYKNGKRRGTGKAVLPIEAAMDAISCCL